MEPCSSEDAGKALGPASHARDHVHLEGLGCHGGLSHARVVVARVVARAARDVALLVIFPNGRVRLVVGREEVGIESRVHRTVLLGRGGNETALAANTGGTVGPGDVVETDVASSCVQRDGVCTGKA